VLVGRGEIWTLSKAGKTIGALHRLESGRYSQSHRPSVKALKLSLLIKESIFVPQALEIVNFCRFFHLNPKPD
jgi:hypothetical protein